MHIAILAPSCRSFISLLLPNYDIDQLPKGYEGAPFIGTIIEELLLLGHQVTAITTTVALNEDYEVKQFSYNNFTWIIVPYRPHSFRPNGNKIGRILNLYAYEQIEIIKCIRSIKPDFIHAHWSYEFAGAAIKSEIPCLVTIHDNAFKVLYFFKTMYRFGRLLMSETILRKVRFASTVSPYMLPYVKNRCLNVKVIANPVQIEASHAEIESLVLHKSKTLSTPKIVMINNGWNSLKNVTSGLLAFKKFQIEFKNASLHLFGDGYEDKSMANKEAKKLGIKNIFFWGSVSHKLLLNELKSAHLLIHPALEESFGVVLIEAMSLGVPVIGGIASGAVPWVINNGRLLVDVNKPNEIMRTMKEVISNPIYYNEIAIKGFENVVARFSSKSVVAEYYNYYIEILKNW